MYTARITQNFMHYGINCEKSTKACLQKDTLEKALCQMVTDSVDVGYHQTRQDASHGRLLKKEERFMQDLVRSLGAHLFGPERIFEKLSWTPLRDEALY